MQDCRFDCVTIIGVGLLGASLGLALKQRSLAGRIIGVGRAGSDSLPIALQRQAIDIAQTDPAPAVREASLVVLAVHIGQFPAIFERIAEALPSGALVTDVGSTKTQVMHWATKRLPIHVDFIGSHPMAGSEKRGPQFARPDLFENAVCLVCPPPIHARGPRTGQRVESATNRVEALWRAIGMKTHRLDARRHDQWVAAVSHLPHAVAAALVLAASETPQALSAIAGGFLDTTRIASADPVIWTDIFLTNKPAVINQLTVFIRRLRTLQTAIRRGDHGVVADLLQQAKTTRDTLANNRNPG